MEAEVIGVDRNRALIAECNAVARNVGFKGLHFQCGDVESFEPRDIDLLIALHACDTATDVAIHKGVVAGAAIVMAVPCCQKELRPQFKAPPDEQAIFKHDTFKDRFSQMLTDALRGLLLEAAGYRTRVIEFISDAHTHRNVMIIGLRGRDDQRAARLREEIAGLKGRYGITRHSLESLLENR
jgi:hypothetical protein